MITTLLSDFSRVILIPKNRNYQGNLIDLHNKLSENSDYKLLDYFEFNRELLDYYKKLKNKFSINIFTTGTMIVVAEEHKLLDPIFERIYISNDMGLNKDDENAYLWIAKDLGKTPNEILFIDDDLKSIEAAKRAGLQTVHFVTTQQAISEIENYAQD